MNFRPYFQATSSFIVQSLELCSNDIWLNNLLQVAGWGADGVIVGSAMVRLLGEAKSPQEGLKELENFTRSLRSALD